MAKAQGVHLVGSSGFDSGSTTFRKCSSGMPNRLKRIPDGETGVRHYFTFWQSAFFQSVPDMLTEFKDNAPIPHKDYTPEQVEAGIEKLKKANPETGYDAAAIESYAEFKRLKDQGVVHAKTKFQVSIPGIASVMPFVQKDFQAAAFPVYEDALLRAMRNIQEQIPHEELSIQIDLAGETAIAEDFMIYPAWFHSGPDELEKRKAYMNEYLLRMIAQVGSDVELGIHNCYGE